jgi:valyl-tRNA synthetase
VDEKGRTDVGRVILADEKMLPADPMTDSPPGYAAGQRDQPGGFRAETDVFDTWFTSSLTPQIVGGGALDPGRPGLPLPMDLRPQSHEIIRTWAFYTIVKALLHEGTIPWRHVAISGWVLDPDRKKMSKSKGNVITPMHLLDQYGSDAVRYWSLSARLGTDTAFDEKVLKVGRRLVTKLFNAGKFVLSQSGPEAPITRTLDLSFLACLRETVDAAGKAMDDFEYASALGTVERFFWSGFTDAYVEMAKNRAKSETDPEGRGSAVATLQLALGVLLRLFAPFLPYISEEVWSWGFAKAQGARSIHRAPWPTAAEFSTLKAKGALDVGGGPFGVAVAFLEAVHRAKTAAGASVGRHVDRLRVAGSPATIAQLQPVQDDLLAAARAAQLGIEPREGMEDDTFEVLECTLAPLPPPPPAP